jgi:histone H3/H4
MKYIGEKKRTSHLEIMNANVERHVKRTARDFRISTGMIGDLAYLDSMRTNMAARKIEIMIGAI